MRAFVFPGQGSQFCGMGRDLYQAFPEARRVFEEADDELAFSLSRLCFEGPDEKLVLTEYTQPAVLTVSLAVWSVLKSRGDTPEFVAGHSLGEYSALVVAGCLRFRDAVRIVRLRGRFMQEAVPRGRGAMAAVLGLDASTLYEICSRASENGSVVSLANLNSPEQIVLAGNTEAVERAGGLANSAGARRVVPLAVSAPFHCELMKPAQEKLTPILEDVPFADLQIPLVNNADARPVNSGVEARQGLIRQVVAPVRWAESVLKLKDMGAQSFVEVGPGKVLSGLIRRTDRDSKTYNVGTVEEVDAYV